MTYIKVSWKHSNPNYPVLLFSELDDSRSETRKVEVFPDGTVGFADPAERAKSTGLGLEPLPPLEEIAENPEFEPEEITKEEFERMWTKRRSRAV